MIQEDIEETPTNKSDRLISIIESVYNLDLKTRSRERKYIGARISYSYILRGLGFGWTYIGLTINRTHATIINNVKQFDTYMKFDPNFKELHEIIADKFDIDDVIIFDSKMLELENQVSTLNLKVKELDSQNSIANFELKNLKEFSKKNKSMHQLINHKVKPETEKEIEFKLKRILNGI